MKLEEVTQKGSDGDPAGRPVEEGGPLRAGVRCRWTDACSCTLVILLGRCQSLFWFGVWSRGP